MTEKKFDPQEFLAFCRSKPADQGYDPQDGQQCALAQFGYPWVSTYTVSERGLTREIYTAAVRQAPFTFGALADRLEQALS